MRDIKFRAWDKPSKTMCEQVSELFWSAGGLRAVGPGYFIGEGENKDLVDDYHIVLMQFTGLKDKNGKEIYEGDIVTCRYDQDHQRTPSMVVIEPLLGFGTRLPDGVWNGRLSTWLDHECEVIGNIYENPELLKAA